MRKTAFIGLEDAKAAVKRGLGTVKNQNGWCVFVNAAGEPNFIYDEVASKPISHREASVLFQLSQSSQGLIRINI